MIIRATTREQTDESYLFHLERRCLYLPIGPFCRIGWLGAAVGACNVEATDSLSGVRPWDVTLRRVQNGWPKRDLLLDAPGWHFDDHHQ